MHEPVTPVAAAVLAALLLAGCGGSTDDPVPTGGEVTGDTSVIETPTGAATEPTTG
ncbi:hypothetical protein [Jannaschia sp. R86511]|uniref:hypothetical protein n=1 Tax=Jannaschia sp. R86511 TaxID=3093853 RepID=UPI0036D2882B